MEFDLPPVPELAEGAAAVLRFARNENGRDFVVGDVHGMFTSLRQLLDATDFDEEADRLFSVGDLVDRGPESALALEWLSQSWFHACRGNHEQLVLDAVDPEQFDLWVRFNGGAWWQEVDVDRHESYRAAFRRLPLAIEIETDDGPVGVVHADVPPGLTWEQFLVLLEARNGDAMLYSLWSRNRIQGLGSISPVAGAAGRIYCGHTPTRHCVQLENVCYIDTGAVYAAEGYRNARLTMIEIQPRRHVEHCIYTHPEGPDPQCDDGP